MPAQVHRPCPLGLPSGVAIPADHVDQSADFRPGWYLRPGWHLRRSTAAPLEARQVHGSRIPEKLTWAAKRVGVTFKVYQEPP